MPADGTRPFLIGLTGNIATGKSTVAGMLADLGAETIDADKVAHQVMRSDTQVRERIVEAFGPSVMSADDQIDRKRLGAIVFSDPQALSRLEDIVHPATLDAIGRRFAATCADVVVIEAIKLIESGLADACHVVWVTTCRKEQQIARLVSERGLGRAEAKRRVEAQPPQREKIAQADVVIDNSGSLVATREQVVAAWQRLMDEGVNQGARAESSGESALTTGQIPSA